MKRSLLSLLCLTFLAAGFGGTAASADEGHHHFHDATIKADIEAVRAAHKQLREDREHHNIQSLKADRQALRAARKKLHEDIAALRKEHHTPPA